MFINVFFLSFKILFGHLQTQKFLLNFFMVIKFLIGKVLYHNYLTQKKKILNLVSAINNLNLDLNYFENYKAKLNQVSKSTIQNALINSIDFNNISTLSVGKTIE